MAQNMYRVGDYVYFEISSAAPFQVRRIEELNKTNTGNVEAKVLCFYRRRDIPRALLKIADRAERVEDRTLINSRRRLGLPSAESSGVNGDVKIESSSDDEAGTKSSENGLSTEASKESNTKERQDSESPKPMQVDTGEEEPDNKKGEDGNKEDGKEDEDADEESDGEDDKGVEGGYGIGGLPLGADKLDSRERHMLRQHELFLSRQTEALPATHIRGKCSVTLLSEVETPDSYLGHDDAFFYSLVYDPVAMTLLADKGEIRVGEKYQCVVPETMEIDAQQEDNKENGNLVIAEEEGEEPVVSTTDREVIVYHPHHNLTDRDIDQFLIIARAVGTFSRALDTSSSMKLPTLHMTAAAASRDVTLLHAMALLHQANYDIGQAVKYLVPPPSKQHYPLDADKATSHNTVSLGGPILCRDQMEEWSAAEANLFEEAIEKYGKDFNDIRGDFLPWKSLRDIIEYYYMWKTTNRYVEIKKNKAIEQESKLKQVYIPNYNKPNPNLVGPPNPSGVLVRGTSPCESCQVAESSQWYAWGPAHLQLRLCSECWTHWKKNGGLKRLHEYESYDLDGAASQDMLNPAQQAQMQKAQATAVITSGALNRTGFTIPTSQAGRNGGIAGRPTGGQVIARLPPNHPQQVALQQKLAAAAAAPSVPLGPKTRVAFYLNTTLPMRIARRLAPKSLLNIRRSARRPFLPINGLAIKQYCTTRQPMEIIRAAKQIKAPKMSDAMLGQLAASIIASGSQLAQFASVQPSNLKRPLSGADKALPPAKRQQQQQQQHAHQSYHPAQMCHQTATTSSHHLPQVSSAQHSHQHRPQYNPAQQKGSSHGPSKGAPRVPDLKPTAAVPPLPILPNVMVPANLAAVVAKGMQQQLASTSRTVPPGSINVANKDASMAASVKKASYPDSRWTGADEKFLFLAGPRLKMLRKRVCSKKMARRIALHPCRHNDFAIKQLPNLQGLFS